MSGSHLFTYMGTIQCHSVWLYVSLAFFLYDKLNVGPNLYIVTESIFLSLWGKLALQTFPRRKCV